jgi:hypothetical protein
MKTRNKFAMLIFVGFMLFGFKGMSQSQYKLGCFNGTTGTMAYSTSQMNTILSLLIGGGTVTNSTIKYDTDKYGAGFFYLVGKLNGTTLVGIDLDQSGNNLYVSATKCSHSCTSTGTCTCDLKIVERCVSIQCNYSVGEGGCSSSVTTGLTISSDFVEFVTNNSPLCQ